MDDGSPQSRMFLEEEFRRMLTWEVQRATRYQDFLSLCLVNVEYPGERDPAIHAAVARRFGELLRSSDIVGMVGDSIALLLVHAPRSEAETIVERTCLSVREAGFVVADDAMPLHVEVEAALVSFPTDATTDLLLLARAKELLARRA
jgi:GGDEF domain-containing protein